ncbi:hypothetical protein [Candidatus Methanoperedens nitratireducens]|uniref:hypothetical protein n=1 Tax=Candidatus Methanoperedens nitratireducens TaxID=1392998 RepID=UPI000BB77E3B|nr:hypothetical protein [Candidatus Methanoperedens nitroreducens]
MLLRTFTLILASTRPIRGSAPELRGFFATKFNEYSPLHQHNADKLIYRYPPAQYKTTDGAPGTIDCAENLILNDQPFYPFKMIPVVRQEPVSTLQCD